MQQLTVDFIVSLDGYGSARGWPGWWGLQSEEYLAWLEQQARRPVITLMGATTYRAMSEMSAAARLDADDSAEGDAFTDLDERPKVVFSSTLTEPLSWPNTTLVTGDAAEAVARMKREGDLPLYTMGSRSLCRSLLAAGLVDRFRVVIFPVITGATGEERIYDDYPDVGLELVLARTFDGGLQLLEYVPTVLTARPGASPLDPASRRPQEGR